MKNISYLWSEIDRGHVRLKGEVPTLSHFLFWYVLLNIGTMKEIKLTQGKVALIDDEDYDRLNQWRWYAWRCGNTYYAVRKKKNPTIFILMHRLILDTPSDMQVDHKDRNGLNNQKSNIRNCNNSDNQHNKIGWSKSGFKGVYLNTYKRKTIKFRAMIQNDGKYLHLGYYDTAEDAARAYDKAALIYFGEFARTNF